MINNFATTGIDWAGDGYHNCPDSVPENEWPEELKTPDWRAWTKILSSAKRGDFSEVPGLIALYLKPSTAVFKRACIYLLGDAGIPESFAELISILKKTTVMNYDRILDICNALHMGGRIDYVPPLLNSYQKLAKVENDEADTIKLYISRLIEPEPDPETPMLKSPSTAVYSRRVKSLYSRTKKAPPPENPYVVFGQKFDVKRFAMACLDRFQEPHVNTFNRRKFEASTGIDCSMFYKDGVFQPLSASAIVREFLDSPEAEKYPEGSRYFFGHRIPD